VIEHGRGRHRSIAITRRLASDLKKKKGILKVARFLGGERFSWRHCRMGKKEFLRFPAEKGAVGKKKGRGELRLTGKP